MYNSGDASVRVCGPVGAIVTGVATPAASACSSEPNSLRGEAIAVCYFTRFQQRGTPSILVRRAGQTRGVTYQASGLRSEEHTSELQSRFDLVCRLLLE